LYNISQNLKNIDLYKYLIHFIFFGINVKSINVKLIFYMSQYWIKSKSLLQKFKALSDIKNLSLKDLPLFLDIKNYILIFLIEIYFKQYISLK